MERVGAGCLKCEREGLTGSVPRVEAAIVGDDVVQAASVKVRAMATARIGMRSGADMLPPFTASWSHQRRTATQVSVVGELTNTIWTPTFS